MFNSTKLTTMNKLFSIILIAVTLFSCSSDDKETVIIPKTLQKIVFYRDSPNQRQWNISNGLLISITLADGTLAEEFIYDTNKRVIAEKKYTGGVLTETNTIAYTSDNIIESINGLHYNFDAATQTYIYSYGSNFTIHCKVNEDKLAVDFVRSGFKASEYHMTYANGNMTSFRKVNNVGSDVIKNFHFTTGMISEGGSFYNAVLSVAQVKSLTDPNFFVDCQVSKVDPDGFDNGVTDPYYYNYGAIPNMDGTLLQVGVEVLDSNNNPVSWYSFADYYYE